MLGAQAVLSKEGLRVRVVSMPCFELFDDQDQAYQDSVLPPDVDARIACEAGIRQCWDKYLGRKGRFVGMSSFGASGPFNKLYEHFKITADQIVSHARVLLG